MCGVTACVEEQHVLNIHDVLMCVSGCHFVGSTSLGNSVLCVQAHVLDRQLW